MATNQVRWLRNINGAPAPVRGAGIALGKFAAGSSQAIKRGEILELTGNTNTEWVPIDSDFSMSANIAVAAEEILSGDPAGYYEIYTPRPGDVFQFELATAAAVAVGASLYYSSSEKVTTSGSNAIGKACGQEHYPSKQHHLASGELGDQGTTIKSTSYVEMTFTKAASYYAALEG